GTASAAPTAHPSTSRLHHDRATPGTYQACGSTDAMLEGFSRPGRTAGWGAAVARSPVRRKSARMPSPFPGMDPYLENTDFWEGFHNGFMHYVQEDLQPRLPENYVATL